MPVVITQAGGYAPQIQDIEQAHCNTIRKALQIAAAAVFVLALLLNYFGFHRNDPGITNSGQPRYEIATIDLRNASTARSVQPSGTTSTQPQIEIPRAIVSLTIDLPIGSEEGHYDVAIRRPTKNVAELQAGGTAHLDRGITKLTISLDTSSIPSGDYELAWRMTDFDWRSYPIRIP